MEKKGKWILRKGDGMVTEWHWMVNEMYLPFSRLYGEWKVTEWRLSVFTEWCTWRFVLWWVSPCTLKHYTLSQLWHSIDPASKSLVKCSIISTLSRNYVDVLFTERNLHMILSFLKQDLCQQIDLEFGPEYLLSLMIVIVRLPNARQQLWMARFLRMRPQKPRFLVRERVACLRILNHFIFIYLAS